MLRHAGLSWQKIQRSRTTNYQNIGSTYDCIATSWSVERSFKSSVFVGTHRSQFFETEDLKPESNNGISLFQSVFHQPGYLHLRNLTTDRLGQRYAQDSENNLDVSAQIHAHSRKIYEDPKISMELLAQSVLSSHKINNDSSITDDTKKITNKSIFQDSEKVIKYYSDTQTDGLRSLPLSVSMTGSNPQFALDGPYVCHAILKTIILPQLQEASTNGTILNRDVDKAIQMSLDTTQSLVDLVSSRSSTHSLSSTDDASDSSRDIIGDYDSTNHSMLDGIKAEEILKVILSIRIQHTNKENEEKQRKRSKKLLYLFNETMNLWVYIASTLLHTPQASRDAALRAENLLLDLILTQNSQLDIVGADKDYQQDLVPSNNDILRYFILAPNIVSFNIVINAWSTAAGCLDASTSINCAERAESILRMMQELSENNVDGLRSDNIDVKYIQPDQISYDQVIQAHAKCQDYAAPSRALAIFELMMEQYWSIHDTFDKANRELDRQSSKSITRFNITLTSMMESWTTVRSSLSQQQAIDDAEALFSRTIELGGRGDEALHPDVISFNTLLSIYSKQQAGYWAKKKKKTKGNSHNLRGESDPQEIFDFKNDDDMISSMEYQLEKCQRMEQIVQDMRNVKGCSPDIITYDTVMKAWNGLALATQKIIADKKYLNTKKKEMLHKILLECADHLKTNLYAMIRLVDEQSSMNPYEERAAKIMKSILMVYQQIGSLEAIETAENLLYEIENRLLNHKWIRLEPNLFHYSIIMKAFANIGTTESAKKVEEIYNTFSAKCSKMMPLLNDCDQDVHELFQLDTFCYNYLIHAWCNVGTLDSLQKAESLLDRLLAESSNDSLSPNSFSFSILLKAYLRLNHRTAAESSERVLKKMLKFHTEYANQIDDLYLLTYFNMVLDKYGRTQKDCLYEKSLDILENMINHANRSTIDENASKQIVIGFNICMNNVSRQGKGDPRKVEKIFNIMEQRFRDNSSYVQPDDVSFSTLLKSWAGSKKKNAPQKVREILDKNIRTYHHQLKNGRKNIAHQLRPDIGRFNLVFKACAKAPSRHQHDQIVSRSDDMDNEQNHRNNPLDVALITLSQIQSNTDLNWNVEPTYATYTLLFTIIKKQMPGENPKRAQLLFHLFKQCCKDGHLTEMVLDKFQDAVANEEMFHYYIKRSKESMANNTTVSEPSEWKSIHDFPSQWKRKANQMLRSKKDSKTRRTKSTTRRR